MHIRISDYEVLLFGIGNLLCNWEPYFSGLTLSLKKHDEIIFVFFKQVFLTGYTFQLIYVEPRDDYFFYHFILFYPGYISSHKNPKFFDFRIVSFLCPPSGVSNGIYPTRIEDNHSNSLYISSRNFLVGEKI